MDRFEEFKIINGYKIFRNGTIIGKKGKPLSTKVGSNGYISCHINLGELGMFYNQHRVIATIFIPNPENKPEVNHKDGIKHHNWDTNLEWCTEKENQNHATEVLKRRVGTNNYHCKLSEEDVLRIYELCKNGVKRADIAREYNLYPQEIRHITTLKNWKHLGLEPLPPMKRGSGGKGSKHELYSYKITNLETNEEFIFKDMEVASKELGCSAPMIRNYANKIYTNKTLLMGKYNVEKIDRIKSK